MSRHVRFTPKSRRFGAPAERSEKGQEQTSSFRWPKAHGVLTILSPFDDVRLPAIADPVALQRSIQETVGLTPAGNAVPPAARVCAALSLKLARHVDPAARTFQSSPVPTGKPGGCIVGAVKKT
jgi:hypothetical protein